MCKHINTHIHLKNGKVKNAGRKNFRENHYCNYIIHFYSMRLLILKLFSLLITLSAKGKNESRIANANNIILLIRMIYNFQNKKHMCLMDSGNGIILLISISCMNVNSLAKWTNVNFYFFVFSNRRQFVFIRQCKTSFLL